LDLALKHLLHIPNLDLRIPTSRGEKPAVGAKPDSGSIVLVSLPFPEFLAGLCLPESDKAVLRGRGQVLAIGAEDDAIDGALVAQGGKGAVPEPLEVAPFPAAQVLRALPEQIFHSTQVVGPP